MRLRPISAIPTLGWPAWLATLASFALLCAVIAYWATQLLAPATPVAPALPASAQPALADLSAAARLFGAGADAGGGAARPSNIVVVGVLSAGARGSAILAVDGKPAKPYGVGDRVGDGQLLIAVRADAVVIGADGVRTELPAPPPPDLAVLRGAPRPTSAAPSTGTPGLPPGTTPPGTLVIPPPAPPGPADVPATPGMPGTAMPGAGAQMPGMAAPMPTLPASAAVPGPSPVPVGVTQ